MWKELTLFCGELSHSSFKITILLTKTHDVSLDALQLGVHLVKFSISCLHAMTHCIAEVVCDTLAFLSLKLHFCQSWCVVIIVVGVDWKNDVTHNYSEYAKLFVVRYITFTYKKLY